MNRPREEARDPAAVHNMWMRPPLTVRIRPLHPPEEGPPAPRPTAIARVDFPHLYDRGAREKRWRRARRDLERLALIAEAAAGIDPPREPPGRQMEEELVDRVVRAGSLLDPEELGLPPIAVMARGAGPQEGSPELDPRVAVCLLTRLSGPLFVARRQPHVPPLELLQEPVRFFAMEVPHALHDVQ